MSTEQSKVQDDHLSNLESADGDQVQDEVQTIEVNGEHIPLDELKKGYMRQADYTRKTQEIAEAKRTLARRPEHSTGGKEEPSEEVKKAISLLKQHGVVTKDDLEALQAQQQDANEFNDFISSNPDLVNYASAIKAIGATDNRSWQDIAISYGFTSKDKLAKAKASRPIIGNSVPTEPKTRSITELSDAEFAEWEKNHAGHGKFRKN